MDFENQDENSAYPSLGCWQPSLKQSLRGGGISLYIKCRTIKLSTISLHAAPLPFYLAAYKLRQRIMTS
jgi:hypothetical protein